MQPLVDATFGLCVWAVCLSEGDSGLQLLMMTQVASWSFYGTFESSESPLECI